MFKTPDTMCKVYNEIGSLTAIISHLHRNDITEFNSINALLAFQNNYPCAREQIISSHAILIEQEKETLGNEIIQLEADTEESKLEYRQKLQTNLSRLQQQLDLAPDNHSNIFSTLYGYCKKYWLKSKIQGILRNFESKISNSVKESVAALTAKRERFQYINSFFHEAVNQSSLNEIAQLERKKKNIDEIKLFIFGAIGEEKVCNELKKLSDNYVLINDFNYSFHPHIYYQQEQSYTIKSIQVDHVLVSPAGIFLIETKNWSEKSQNNINLRSPVEQIKRNGYALYRILSWHMKNSLNWHHWGERKIPVRNLIVFINQKPIQSFQFVKILTLKELCNYVEYFEPVLSPDEIHSISNYLVNMNRRFD